MAKKVTTTEARAALVEYFRGKSQLRERKAEQFPQDTRNSRSAKTLSDIAAYIAALGANDPLLVRLVNFREVSLNHDVISFFENGVFSLPMKNYEDGEGSKRDREAFQCGFHKTITSPATWLDAWIESLEEEAGMS